MRGRSVLLVLLVGVLGGPVISQGMAAVVPTQRPPAPTPQLTTLREFLPLAHARYFGDAELVLANFGPSPIAVTPTWIVHDQDPVAGDPILVLPIEPQFLPIGDVLPKGVTLSTLDGLLLVYSGRAVMHVVGQVTLLPKSGSQARHSLDVPPTIPVDVRGPRIEAVWAPTSRDERAVIVVANLSDFEQDITATHPSGVDRFLLDAGDVHVLNLATQRGAQGADWVTIEGNRTGIRATGFAMAPADGQPRLIRFYDPSSAARPDLWASGVRLNSAGVSASIKNTSDIAVRVTPTLLDPENGTVLAYLPPLDLDKHAAATIPLGTGISGGTSAPMGTLHVVSLAGPGSVIGAVQMPDRMSGLLLDRPLRDSGWDNTSYRRATGNCAWRLDGDYNTVVSVTNVGDADARFHILFRHGGGDYAPSPAMLTAGGTKTFDLRQLRDQQVPDRPRGRPLPKNVERGTCHWSIEAPASARLMGQAEIMSRSQHVSSSHSW